MKVVIIGNHAAGLSAAQTLREGDEACSITVVSKEKAPPYSRCLIPFLVSGEKKLTDILFKPEGFYERHCVTPLLGLEALRVFPRENKVLLEDDRKVEYDFLIIASGGTVSLPALPGIRNQGVFGFRTLQDAQMIVDYLPEVETAAILGGGPIGIKAALALRERGKRVKLLVSSSSILSQIVGEIEAQMVEEYLKDLGIDIRKRVSPAKLLGAGRVEGLETTEGEKIDCQMVIVGKGVNANKGLVKGTEVQTEYGILVDQHCRTNIPNIFAAGDVTQSQDNVRRERWMNALWPLAVEEGRVAAENVLGKNSVLRPRTSMNSLKIDGLGLMCCGLTGVRERVEGSEEIILRGPGKWNYKRFVLKEDHLIGYVLVGDVAYGGVLSSLVCRQVELGKFREHLCGGRFDFASILPLIKENRETFAEPEYQEVLAFCE